MKRLLLILILVLATVVTTSAQARLWLGAYRARIVAIVPVTLTITTVTLPDCTIGTACASTVLLNVGGTAAFTWDESGTALGTLACTGISLSSGGTVSGTPTATGLCTFTARVTDSLGAVDTQVLTFTVEDGAFLEAAGVVVMEAENANISISRSNQTWVPVSTPASFVGVSAMQSNSNVGAQYDPPYATTAPELQYKVNFVTTGTYYIWGRVYVDSLTDNRLHAGIDGVETDTANKIVELTLDSWQWTNDTGDGPRATLVVGSTGVHTINLWMHEDGIILDRLLLTTNSGTTPTGNGPAESARSGFTPPLPHCSDTLDNDSDTFTDYPADPGCSSTLDNDEVNAVDPPSATCPVGSTNIAPGANIQTALTAGAIGARFCLKTGMHRITATLSPKNNQQIWGEPGTVLSGAKVITGATASGSDWAFSGQTQENVPAVVPCASGSGTCPNCEVGWSRCNRPEDLYIDSETMLRHVATRAELGTGKYYFDYAANIIYMRDNPSGHLIETSQGVEKAFNSSASGVQLRGFTIEKFGTVMQQAAVTLGPDAIYDNMRMRHNHARALNWSTRVRVTNCSLNDNGQMGVGGSGNDGLFENNEVARNNTVHVTSGWEAGGSKWVRTNGLIVRGNHFHRNNGAGIWMDIDNGNALIENNISELNKSGIAQEIGQSAIIRNNISRNNGTTFGTPVYPYPNWVEGGGIMIVNSRDVEVYGNTLTDNWQGIVLDQDLRDPVRWPLINVYVHDNTTTVTAAARALAPNGGNGGFRTGLVDKRSGQPATLAPANNRFENNDYILASGSWLAFFWGVSYPNISDAAWLALGHETGGSITRK